MKTLLILLLAIPVSGQVSGVVYDRDARQGIPYATIWVNNKNLGTVADSLGRFGIEAVTLKDSLHTSALGYKNNSAILAHTNDTIFLERQAFLLEEVAINRHAGGKHTIGSIDSKVSLTVDFSGGSNGNDRLIIAHAFRDIDITGSYLEMIRLRAYSEYKGQRIAISFREIGDDGYPGSFINSTPMIYKLKRGKNSMLKIDLAKYNIRVPAKGFFITFEKYSDEAEDLKSFGPFISMAKNTRSAGTLKWGLRDGKWQWYYFKNQEIIMEVEFTRN